MNPTIANAADGRAAGPEPQQADPAQLMDVKAVAALLECSPRHVYRLRDGGRMPSPLRLGALVRWRRTDVLAWIAGGCQPVRTREGATR